jgi:hypothetical protein
LDLLFEALDLVFRDEALDDHACVLLDGLENIIGPGGIMEFLNPRFYLGTHRIIGSVWDLEGDSI